MKPPMTAYESGLCVWNDDAERFERHRVLWTKTPESPEPPPAPDGHAAFWTDAAGKKWVLFGNPFPSLKCAATFEAWSDPEAWEVIEPQKTVPSRRRQADRAASRLDRLERLSQEVGRRLHARVRQAVGARRDLVCRGRRADRAVGPGGQGA